MPPVAFVVVALAAGAVAVRRRVGWGSCSPGRRQAHRNLPLPAAADRSPGGNSGGNLLIKQHQGIIHREYNLSWGCCCEAAGWLG